MTAIILLPVSVYSVYMHTKHCFIFVLAIPMVKSGSAVYVLMEFTKNVSPLKDKKTGKTTKRVSPYKKRTSITDKNALKMFQSARYP